MKPKEILASAQLPETLLRILLTSYKTRTQGTMPQVSAAQYGKDNIRVYKVHKDEKTGVQTVVEMTVCVLLKGDIETS